MGTHPIFESDFDCLTDGRVGQICRSSLKPSRGKRSPLRSKPLTPSRMSRLRSRTRKEFPLHLVLRLRGGGKKRKKKVYTTPKKNKHKNKKEKLRVLKYYKVDDNGKITRLRKECPVAGPGCFMANHADRYYSGKNGHTIFIDKSKK